MRSPSVVVRLVLVQDQPQVSFARDQHPVGDLRRGGEYEPFGIGVRPGLRGGICAASIPAPARAASNDCGELPGSVADY
jgi:hypothetical protein